MKFDFNLLSFWLGLLLGWFLFLICEKIRQWTIRRKQRKWNKFRTEKYKEQKEMEQTEKFKCCHCGKIVDRSEILFGTSCLSGLRYFYCKECDKETNGFLASP